MLAIEDDSDKKIAIDEYSRSRKESREVNVLGLGDQMRGRWTLTATGGDGVRLTMSRRKDAQDAKAES